MIRTSVPAVDELIGHKFEVLDDGFVRIVDYMGSDDSVVQAARVSYGEGATRVHEDRGLIRYLMRHRHNTPFEMCELKLHVRVPMDCWHQWIRHRTANVNEYSTRYSIAIDSAQKTQPTDWRVQSSTNKQGSDSSNLPKSNRTELSKREASFLDLARDVYQERVEHGVAREQARKDLPLSTYTEAYWKIDLHNLLHFLQLRMDTHAQYEIRQYANTIGQEIVSKWCPMVWEAFEDFRIASLQLSAREVEIINAINSGDMSKADSLAKEYSWLSTDGEVRKNRERVEAEQKFDLLGLLVPWDGSA